MIVTGKIIGGNITLQKGDKLIRVHLINCNIDDSEANITEALEGECIIEGGSVYSQWRAMRKLEG